MNAPEMPESTPLSPRFAQALTLAHELFASTQRKGSHVPYIAHLLSVASLVLYDGGDEDEAIAALLHDTLEDRPDVVTRVWLEKQFGTRVSAIVAATTDTPDDYTGGPKASWLSRKIAWLTKIRNSTPDLLRISLADKVDNARSILRDRAAIGEEVWKRFNASKADILWYYTEAVKAFSQAGVQGPLLNDLTALLKEMRLGVQEPEQ